MALISITGRSTGQQYGREAKAYERSLDGLFAIMNRGKPTSEEARARLAEEVDAVLEAAGDLLPITASARRSMKAVRLPNDRSRPDLAEVTDSFWKRYRAKHPQPEKPRRTLISNLRRAP